MTQHEYDFEPLLGDWEIDEQGDFRKKRLFAWFRKKNARYSSVEVKRCECSHPLLAMLQDVGAIPGDTIVGSHPPHIEIGVGNSTKMEFLCKLPPNLKEALFEYAEKRRELDRINREDGARQALFAKGVGVNLKDEK